jgi:hypothetical protein
MRIKRNNSPKVGETRQITKFLWFPLAIDGETRWLETATYTEEYIKIYDSNEGYTDTFWRPSYWGAKCPHGHEDWNDCPVCGH